MLLTFIATVKIPRDELGNMDAGAKPLYHCVWVMHISSALVVLMNQNFSNKLGIFKYTLNTVQMLFNVVVMIFICMEFFVKKEDGEDPSSDKPKEAKTDEVKVETK